MVVEEMTFSLPRTTVPGISMKILLSKIGTDSIARSKRGVSRKTLHLGCNIPE